MEQNKCEDFAYLPKVDFSTFIASLNASAMVALGAMADPEGGQSKNLVMGKHTIDVLEMLKTKTKGNLTKEESDMLDHILYDLRMIFVKERR